MAVRRPADVGSRRAFGAGAREDTCSCRRAEARRPLAARARERRVQPPAGEGLRRDAPPVRPPPVRVLNASVGGARRRARHAGRRKAARGAGHRDGRLARGRAAAGVRGLAGRPCCDRTARGPARHGSRHVPGVRRHSQRSCGERASRGAGAGRIAGHRDNGVWPGSRDPVPRVPRHPASADGAPDRGP